MTRPSRKDKSVGVSRNLIEDGGSQLNFVDHVIKPEDLCDTPLPSRSLGFSSRNAKPLPTRVERIGRQMRYAVSQSGKCFPFAQEDQSRSSIATLLLSLPTDILQRLASFLTAHDVCVKFRPLCRDMRARFDADGCWCAAALNIPGRLLITNQTARYHPTLSNSTSARSSSEQLPWPISSWHCVSRYFALPVCLLSSQICHRNKRRRPHRRTLLYTHCQDSLESTNASDPPRCPYSPQRCESYVAVSHGKPSADHYSGLSPLLNLDRITALFQCPQPHCRVLLPRQPSLYAFASDNVRTTVGSADFADRSTIDLNTGNLGRHSAPAIHPMSPTLSQQSNLSEYSSSSHISSASGESKFPCRSRWDPYTSSSSSGEEDCPDNMNYQSSFKLPRGWGESSSLPPPMMTSSPSPGDSNAYADIHRPRPAVPRFHPDWVIPQVYRAANPFFSQSRRGSSGIHHPSTAYYPSTNAGLSQSESQTPVAPRWLNGAWSVGRLPHRLDWRNTSRTASDNKDHVRLASHFESPIDHVPTSKFSRYPCFFNSRRPLPPLPLRFIRENSSSSLFLRSLNRSSQPHSRIASEFPSYILESAVNDTEKQLRDQQVKPTSPPWGESEPCQFTFLDFLQLWMLDPVARVRIGHVCLYDNPRHQSGPKCPGEFTCPGIAESAEFHHRPAPRSHGACWRYWAASALDSFDACLQMGSSRASSEVLRVSAAAPALTPIITGCTSPPLSAVDLCVERLDLHSTAGLGYLYILSHLRTPIRFPWLTELTIDSGIFRQSSLKKNPESAKPKRGCTHTPWIFGNIPKAKAALDIDEDASETPWQDSDSEDERVPTLAGYHATHDASQAQAPTKSSSTLPQCPPADKLPKRINELPEYRQTCAVHSLLSPTHCLSSTATSTIILALLAGDTHGRSPWPSRIARHARRRVHRWLAAKANQLFPHLRVLRLTNFYQRPAQGRPSRRPAQALRCFSGCENLQELRLKIDDPAAVQFGGAMRRWAEAATTRLGCGSACGQSDDNLPSDIAMSRSNRATNLRLITFEVGDYGESVIPLSLNSSIHTDLLASIGIPYVRQRVKATRSLESTVSVMHNGRTCAETASIGKVASHLPIEVPTSRKSTEIAIHCPKFELFYRNQFLTRTPPGSGRFLMTSLPYGGARTVYIRHMPLRPDTVSWASIFSSVRAEAAAAGYDRSVQDHLVNLAEQAVGRTVLKCISFDPKVGLPAVGAILPGVETLVIDGGLLDELATRLRTDFIVGDFDEPDAPRSPQHLSHNGEREYAQQQQRLDSRDTSVSYGCAWFYSLRCPVWKDWLNSIQSNPQPLDEMVRRASDKNYGTRMSKDEFDGVAASLCRVVITSCRPASSRPLPSVNPIQQGLQNWELLRQINPHFAQVKIVEFDRPTSEALREFAETMGYY